MNFYNVKLQMLVRTNMLNQAPAIPPTSAVHTADPVENKNKENIDEEVERPEVVFKALFTPQDLTEVSNKFKLSFKQKKENENENKRPYSSRESPLSEMHRQKKDFKPPVLIDKPKFNDIEKTLSEKLTLARKLKEALIETEDEEALNQGKYIEEAFSFLQKYRKSSSTNIYYPPSRVDEMTCIRYERNVSDKDGLTFEELIILPELTDDEEEKNRRRPKKIEKIKSAFLSSSKNAESPETDEEIEEGEVEEESIEKDNLVYNFQDYLSEEDSEVEVYSQKSSEVRQQRSNTSFNKKVAIHTLDSSSLGTNSFEFDRDEIFSLFTVTDLDAANFGIEDRERDTSRSHLEKYNRFFSNETVNGTLKFKLNILNIIEDLEKFAGTPPPVGHLIKCRIARDRRGHHLHPTYFLNLERTDEGRKILILAARKRRKCKTSNYVITTDATDLRRESKKFVGKLRANVLGTQFVLYGPGLSIKDTEHKPFIKLPLMKKKEVDLSTPYREELGVIVYELNVLGSNGPRKSELTIPAMINELSHIEMRPENNHQTIVEKEKSCDFSGLVKLRNKKPIWNDENQTFVLNFQGRVTQASVKNFQIIHEIREDYVILQFGRVGEDSFTLDFRYPLSPLQAFGIALASFDNKIACD